MNEVFKFCMSTSEQSLRFGNSSRLKKEAVEKPNEEINESGDDVSSGHYGDRGLSMSLVEGLSQLTLDVEIGEINESLVGKVVSTSGFLQQTRKTGKQAFVVLRDRLRSVQCIAGVGERVSRQMVRFIGEISRESVVKVTGAVQRVDKPIESCSQSTVELEIHEIFVVSRAEARLPLQIEDASRPVSMATTELPRVSLDTQLDNRVLDLRTAPNIAIFKLQSEVQWAFVDFLRSRGFNKIVPPCIISAASEGGANVFSVSYFSDTAYLAQSPQLYKQMAIISGWKRVYSMGPVFRAENSNTHRHLTEFTGMDVEMELKNHYHEAIHLIGDLLIGIFRHLENHCSAEIDMVYRQFDNIERFRFIEPTLVLTHREGVDMLRDAGVEMDYFDDFSTTNEKFLGRLIKKKFDTDFYALDRYPSAIRPFYTMPDAQDSRYSNSYDFFMRGEEILSGAQRIHDPTQLKESAIKAGINLRTIHDYLESFKLGCPPHAGGGIGLERVVMLYLGLDNIRRCSMYPRDPKRLTP